MILYPKIYDICLNWEKSFIAVIALVRALLSLRIITLGKGSEEKKPYFFGSFAKPGGGVGEGSKKTILLF